MRQKAAKKKIIGWREWVAFPDLGIERVKAKIDTGARTSALHAFRIREVHDRPTPHVEFFVHSAQRRKIPEIKCCAPLVDERIITSSNGEQQKRYTISVRIAIGRKSWPIELTLTDRDEMNFRLLIGREAVRKRFIVDPSTSYRFGK